MSWIERLIGGTLAVTLAPIQLAALLVSLIAYRSWPVFTQTRVGYQRSALQVPKVRTMPVGTDPYAPRSAQSASQPTLRWIRRTRADELLQLWLVAAGKMHIVGPRPLIRQDLETIPHTIQSARAIRHPGCTGLWQVSEYGLEPIKSQPHIDLIYLERRCLQLDIAICVATLRLIVTGQRIGSAALEQLVSAHGQPAPIQTPAEAQSPLAERI